MKYLAVLASLTAVTALAVTGQPAQAANTWQPTMSTQFDTPARAGTVGTVYRDKIFLYDDDAQYKQGNVSVHDGKLDVRLTGKTGAAFYFKPTPKTKGSRYGRYVVKFKVVGGDNYGAAFMLWPNSNRAGDGEIDFPEGRFDKGRKMFGFHHRAPCWTKAQCHEHVSIYTNAASFLTVHTAEIRWSPGGVKYILDGRTLGFVSKWKPTGDHRWTIQTAPQEATASPGHLYIYSAVQSRLR